MGVPAAVLVGLLAFALIVGSLPNINSENHTYLFFDAEIEKSESEKSESKKFKKSNGGPPDAIIEAASSFDLILAWSSVASYKRPSLKKNYKGFHRRTRAPPRQS